MRSFHVEQAPVPPTVPIAEGSLGWGAAGDTAPPAWLCLSSRQA